MSQLIRQKLFKGGVVQVGEATNTMAKLWRRILADLEISAVSLEQQIKRYAKQTAARINNSSATTGAKIVDAGGLKNRVATALTEDAITDKTFFRGVCALKPDRTRVIVEFDWPDGRTTRHGVTYMLNMDDVDDILGDDNEQAE